MKPLKGMKVLDLTNGNGYTTTLLADYGAEVLKIEKPVIGDSNRHYGSNENVESIYQAFYNRGKKSITLDITNQKGQEILKTLVKNFDVLVENAPLGIMDKIGLSYEELEKINPKLIYGSLTGFGKKGEWKDIPAEDLLIQAKSGFISMTGFKEKPSVIGFPISFLYSAAYLASGIVAAYDYAEQTGIGQQVEVNIWESLIGVNEDKLITAAYYLTAPERVGNSYPTTNPTDVYKCKDGYFTLSVGADDHWHRVCMEMGRPDLAEHPIYKNDPERSNHYFGELEHILQEQYATMTIDEADQACRRALVPGGPVNTFKELLVDEQVKAREMILEVTDKKLGTVKMPGKPIKFHTDTENDNQIESAPLLGEHNHEILVDFLNLSVEELELLKTENII